MFVKVYNQDRKVMSLNTNQIESVTWELDDPSARQAKIQTSKGIVYPVNIDEFMKVVPPVSESEMAF